MEEKHTIIHMYRTTQRWKSSNKKKKKTLSINYDFIYLYYSLLLDIQIHISRLKYL